MSGPDPVLPLFGIPIAANSGLEESRQQEIVPSFSGQDVPSTREKPAVRVRPGLLTFGRVSRWATAPGRKPGERRRLAGSTPAPSASFQKGPFGDDAERP